ncbi:hypothetical protein D9M71_484220 [compost metagenome]
MNLVDAQLRVTQAADRVVLVEALVGLGGGLDVPGDQACTERGGQLLGEHGLAGAGLALDQQWAFEGDGRVYRQFQVVCGDVVAGAFELHGSVLCRKPVRASSRARPLPQVLHKFLDMRGTCGSGRARERPNTCFRFVTDYNAGLGGCKRRPGIQSLNTPSRPLSQTSAPAAHTAQ